jgi:hypothetical protein
MKADGLSGAAIASFRNSYLALVCVMDRFVGMATHTNLLELFKLA